MHRPGSAPHLVYGLLQYPDPGYSLEDLAAQLINKVTMLGMARFLDNFGSRYGNVLESTGRKQDEYILTATLQAFALPFAPTPKRQQIPAQNPQSLIAAYASCS